MNRQSILVSHHHARQNIRQLATVVLIAIISIICLTVHASADNHDVRDDAGVLSQQTEEYIKSVNDKQMAKIKGHPQIAVMTVKTTGDEPIEDYAQNIFDKYHFGTKGYDNGVLLLIATKDHKVRMQTGYGIEGVLPDAYVDDLVSDRVKADFRKGNFSAGTRKMVKQMSAKIVKEQDDLRSKSDVSNYQKAADNFVNSLLYAGLAIASVGAVVCGAVFSVLSINRYRKRRPVTAVATNITHHEALAIAEKLKPADKQFVNQLTFAQLCRQLPKVAAEFKRPDSIDRFIDLDNMSVNENLLKQFIDYLLNFYVLTALAQKQITDDSIAVRRLFIDSCDSSQICQPVSDAFYIWAGLSSYEITHTLADYYTPSNRLAAFITLRSTMIHTNTDDIENLAQQALSKWKSDTSCEIFETDKYQSIDPSVFNQISNDIVNEWSAKSYFNGYFGEAATNRDEMINHMLDQKPQRTIEALVKSLYPTIIDCYLDAVKQVIIGKLDNRLAEQHRQEIDREFMQKLRKSPAYNPKDCLQWQFIDGLSVKQKEELLNADDFNTVTATAIATGVAVLAESYNDYDYNNDDNSSWDDDSSSSSWDDDSSSSSHSDDDDDFFHGGGFSDSSDWFGGGGGFSGGGGGTADW